MDPIDTTQQYNSNKPKKRFGFLVLLIPVFLLLIVLLSSDFIGLFAFDKIYSEGNRVGVLIKLSDRGMIWKTVEGEMALGYGGAGVWNFSVDNKNVDKDKIVEELKSASLGLSIIKVHYTERYGSLPWRADTSYLVDKVEILNGNSASQF